MKADSDTPHKDERHHTEPEPYSDSEYEAAGASGPSVDRPGDGRSPSERDRDRVLYSSAFRRLSGITQVVAPSGRYATHNRLTHTLEVAQIAKSIARRLKSRKESGYESAWVDEFGGLDEFTVEAAALAHDLGHPPFGHVAEEALDRLVSRVSGSTDGFEGNAQTFRILTVLAVKNSEFSGLNLTRGTLSAVSKYPWLRFQRKSKQEKWGAFSSERASLDWSREHLPSALQRGDSASGKPEVPFDREIRTLEAQIMDWADDVAYAVHDLEDFYRAGAIPLERMFVDGDELRRLAEVHCNRRPRKDASVEDIVHQFEGSVKNIIELSQPYAGTREDRAALRGFTSAMVGSCIRKVRIIKGAAGEPQLEIDLVQQSLVDFFKDVLWDYVIEGRALSAQRLGQARIVETVFDAICVTGDDKFLRNDGRITSQRSTKFKEAMHLFPLFNKQIFESMEVGEDVAIARCAADIISSLTESQITEIYDRITGHALGSALDPIYS